VPATATLNVMEHLTKTHGIWRRPIEQGGGQTTTDVAHAVIDSL